MVTLFKQYTETKKSKIVFNFFFTVHLHQMEEDFWLVHHTVGHLNETCFSIGPHQVPGVPASERERET